LIVRVVEPFFHVLLVIDLALGLHLVIKGFGDGCHQVPFTFPCRFLIHSVIDGLVGLNHRCDILLGLNGHIACIGVLMPDACDALFFVLVKKSFVNHF